MNENRGNSPSARAHSACLGLGSNADPGYHLPQALALLRRADGVEVTTVSSAWQSPAVGSNGPDYLNAGALVTTRLTRDELKSQLLRLEAELGRVRRAGASGPVTIDIDLLCFDGELLDGNLWDLAYRAVPIAELLPDLLSPTTGEPLSRAARRLAQTTRIMPRPDLLSRP